MVMRLEFYSGLVRSFNVGTTAPNLTQLYGSPWSPVSIVGNLSAMVYLSSRLSIGNSMSIGYSCASLEHGDVKLSCM
jgi:hypothetical protein